MCIVFSKNINGTIVLGKNRDRNYRPSARFFHFEKNGVEMCVFVDLLTGWAEGMNEHGIGIINSSLMVMDDEAEKNRAAKGKKKKDGLRIVNALSQKNLQESYKYLLESKLAGHTFVASEKEIWGIEKTKKHPAHGERMKPSDLHVRTNHGVQYPDAGYTDGKNRASSMLRYLEAKRLLKDVDDIKKLAPCLLDSKFPKGSFYHPIRLCKKGLRTTSQMVMDLKNKTIYFWGLPKYFDLRDEKSALSGKPKIKIIYKEYSEDDLK